MRRTRARTWLAEHEEIEHRFAPRASLIWALIHAPSDWTKLSICNLREVRAEVKYSRTMLKNLSTFNLLKMCDKEPWTPHMVSYVQDLINSSSTCAIQQKSYVPALTVNGVTIAPNLTRLQTMQLYQSATSTTKAPNRSLKPNNVEARMVLLRSCKTKASGNHKIVKIRKRHRSISSNSTKSSLSKVNLKEMWSGLIQLVPVWIFRRLKREERLSLSAHSHLKIRS